MMMMVMVIITTTTWLVTLPPGNQFELPAALLECSFCFLALVFFHWILFFSLSLFLRRSVAFPFQFSSAQLSCERTMLAVWRPMTPDLLLSLLLLLLFGRWHSLTDTLVAITSEWRPLPYNIALLLCFGLLGRHQLPTTNQLLTERPTSLKNQ